MALSHGKSLARKKKKKRNKDKTKFYHPLIGNIRLKEVYNTYFQNSELWNQIRGICSQSKSLPRLPWYYPERFAFNANISWPRVYRTKFDNDKPESIIYGQRKAKYNIFSLYDRKLVVLRTNNFNVALKSAKQFFGLPYCNRKTIDKFPTLLQPLIRVQQLLELLLVRLVENRMNFYFLNLIKEIKSLCLRHKYSKVFSILLKLNLRGKRRGFTFRKRSFLPKGKDCGIGLSLNVVSMPSTQPKVEDEFSFDDAPSEYDFKPYTDLQSHQDLHYDNFNPIEPSSIKVESSELSSEEDYPNEDPDGTELSSETEEDLLKIEEIIRRELK